MDINVGDVLKLKKQHPCGSREWEVLRCGSRFPAEMSGLWTPDHDRKKTVRKKM